MNFDSLSPGASCNFHGHTGGCKKFAKSIDDFISIAQEASDITPVTETTRLGYLPSLMSSLSMPADWLKRPPYLIRPVTNSECTARVASRPRGCRVNREIESKQPNADRQKTRSARFQSVSLVLEFRYAPVSQLVTNMILLPDNFFIRWRVEKWCNSVERATKYI